MALLTCVERKSDVFRQVHCGCGAVLIGVSNLKSDQCYVLFLTNLRNVIRVLVTILLAGKEVVTRVRVFLIMSLINFPIEPA